MEFRFQNCKHFVSGSFVLISRDKPEYPGRRAKDWEDESEIVCVLFNIFDMFMVSRNHHFWNKILKKAKQGPPK